jgi:hypothetical protein
MLVAVPVAAAIGVLARFGVEQYRESLLYRGLSGRQTVRIAPGQIASDLDALHRSVEKDGRP